MKRMFQRCRSAAGTVLCLAASAAAGEGYDAPKLDDATPWLAALFSALFLAVALIVAFRRSGRTHLD